MKTLAALFVLVFSTSALATETDTIQCFSETNYAHHAELTVHADYRMILGASINGSNNSETLSAGTTDPMAPSFQVVLKNGQDITVSYGVLERPYLGTIVIDSETYSCKETF